MRKRRHGCRQRQREAQLAALARLSFIDQAGRKDLPAHDGCDRATRRGDGPTALHCVFSHADARMKGSTAQGAQVAQSNPRCVWHAEGSHESMAHARREVIASHGMMLECRKR